MSTNYARQLLKISVAQILQTIGYQSSQTVALDVLAEILERYITLLCTTTKEYSELACRTESTLDDLGLTFDKLKINTNELEDFVLNVELAKFPLDVVKFPREKENRLGFVYDPTNKELIDRVEDEDKEHIDYYFPLMEKLEENVSLSTSPKPNEEQSNENTQENIVTLKNGSQLDKDQWMSSYESKKQSIKENSPKSAQAKFPPAFYRQRLKPQKSTEKPPAEVVVNEKLIEIDEGKINVPVSDDAPMPVVSSLHTKSTFDDLMDEVVTKYTTDQNKQKQKDDNSTEKTSSHQNSSNENNLKFLKTFGQTKLLSKQTKEILPFDSHSSFTPIKIANDDSVLDENTNESKSSTQLKLKIQPSPIKMHQNHEAKKLNKSKDQASKGLKLKINIGANPNQSQSTPNKPIQITQKVSTIDTFSEIIDQVAKASSVPISTPTALDLSKRPSNTKKQLETSNDNNNLVNSIEHDQRDPIIWKPELGIEEQQNQEQKNTFMPTPPANKPKSKQSKSKPSLQPSQPPAMTQSPLSFLNPFPTFPPINFDYNTLSFYEELSRQAAAGTTQAQETFDFMNFFNNHLFTAQLNELNKNFKPELPISQPATAQPHQSSKQKIKQSSIPKSSDISPRKEPSVKRTPQNLNLSINQSNDANISMNSTINNDLSTTSGNESLNFKKKKKKDKERDRDVEKDHKRKHEKADDKNENKLKLFKSNDFRIQESNRDQSNSKTLFSNLSQDEIQQPSSFQKTVIGQIPKLKLKLGPNPNEAQKKELEISDERKKASPIPKLLIKPVKSQQQATPQFSNDSQKLNPLKIKLKFDNKPDESNEVLSDTPVDVVNVDEPSDSMRQSEFETSSQEQSEVEVLTDKIPNEFKFPVVQSKEDKKKNKKFINFDVKHQQAQLNPTEQNYSNLQLNSYLPGPSHNETKSSKHKHKKKHKSEKNEEPIEKSEKLPQTQQIQPPVLIQNTTQTSQTQSSLQTTSPVQSEANKPSPTVPQKTKKKGINEAIMNIISKKSAMPSSSSLHETSQLEVSPTSHTQPLAMSTNSSGSMIPPPILSTPQKQIDTSNAIEQTQGSISKPMTIMVQTEIYDNAQQVWICPCCKNADDGTPMIGCDSCDDWYHWSCLGINQEPAVNKWYCSKCSGFSESNNKPKKKKKKKSSS